MRETWRLLLEKLRDAVASPSPTSHPSPAAASGVGEALSLEC